MKHRGEDETGQREEGRQVGRKNRKRQKQRNTD